MKTNQKLVAILIALLVVTSCAPIQEKERDQKAENAQTEFKVNPLAGTAIMHPEYVKTIGRMAYVWGWPMVNSHNRRATITQAPEAGRLGGVVPVAPRGHLCMLNDYVKPDQGFVACPNQDVMYGVAFCSLDEEPFVIQVPEFGDRFWVYALYDARTDQFGQMGKA